MSALLVAWVWVVCATPAWYCSCNTNCRAACNYRGTVCGADSDVNTTLVDGRATVASVITLASCACDPGFTGTQCGTLQLARPTGSGPLSSGLVLDLSGDGSGYVSRAPRIVMRLFCCFCYLTVVTLTHTTDQTIFRHTHTQ